MKDNLKQIFDKGLESHDRISLITYSKNARVIFSLVDKDKNNTQLRNQIDRLEAQSKSPSNVFKALKEAVKEFGANAGAAGGDTDNNHRYIICLTNEMGGEDNLRVKREDI